MSKKTSSKSKDEVTYEVRDIVLAKIRGFPAWPAQVVDPNAVDKSVAKERPAGKKSTFYCVRFFPAGDHAWLPPKDLSKLKKHEIEAYISEPHKKNGDLLNGYRVALDPETWEREMERKREAAEEAEADEEVDELEGEEEAGDDEQPAKAAKRKRESEGGSKSKPKVKKEKEAGEAPSKKKKVAEKGDKPAKSKKNGSKSKETVESEDDGERAGHGGPSNNAPEPPAKKAKRDKDDDADGDLDNDPEANRVKELRHKLQRLLLGKTVPKEEDMSNVDALLTEVEQSEMSIKKLQYSKIGKVMRHIAGLDVERVPRDNEFKFQDRAQALVNKWHSIINTTPKPNGSTESMKGADGERPASIANGDAFSVSALTAAPTTAGTEDKKMDETADAQPAVGDTTIAESALGDVTMSEVAA